MDIQKGATDVTLYGVLQDATDGTIETGFDVTTLDLQYTRNRSNPASKVDATALVSPSAVHADNKAVEVDATSSPGLFRVDWPDAAFATGVDKVILCVSGTGFAPVYWHINLVDYPPAKGSVRHSGTRP